MLQRAASLTAAAVASPVLGQQAAPARVRPAGRKPNILLIVTDQQRAHRDLPSAVPLPGHERLLQGAASLCNFHVNTTPCSPSRSAKPFRRTQRAVPRAPSRRWPTRNRWPWAATTP